MYRPSVVSLSETRQTDGLGDTRTWLALSKPHSEKLQLHDEERGIQESQGAIVIVRGESNATYTATRMLRGTVDSGEVPPLKHAMTECRLVVGKRADAGYTHGVSAPAP